MSFMDHFLLPNYQRGKFKIMVPIKFKVWLPEVVFFFFLSLIVFKAFLMTEGKTTGVLETAP